MLHVACEFNETAEPSRPSYALPATLKSEERRHEKMPFKHAPLDHRLGSHAKRLRNDRVCPVQLSAFRGVSEVPFQARQDRFLTIAEIEACSDFRCEQASSCSQSRSRNQY